MGQKSSKNVPPQSCYVRSLTSVMNNACISNDRLRNRITNLIKLTAKEVVLCLEANQNVRFYFQ